MGSIPEDDSATGFSLGSTEPEGQPQFRTFAEQILDFLHTTGLQEADMLRRAPEGNAAAPDPEADADPHDPDLRRFTLENGQTVYVHLDGWRSQHGFKEIAVLTTRQAEETFVGSRAQMAIISAATAMHLPGPSPRGDKTDAIDVRRLRGALAQIEGPLTKSAREHARETMRKMPYGRDQGRNHRQRRESLQRAQEFMHDLQVPSLEYVLALLRYSRRDFDTLPHSDQVELILGTCRHLNHFLTSLRRLVTFVGYSTPDKGLSTKPVESKNRDVKAALLSEVAGLSHKEIGDELGMPLPPSSERKGSHTTAGKSVDRGLTFLKRLFGQDGWQERRASMKAEAERYMALSEEDRIIEDMAESQRISKEEARELREQQRLRYAEWREELDSMRKTSNTNQPRTAEPEDHQT